MFIFHSSIFWFSELVEWHKNDKFFDCDCGNVHTDLARVCVWSPLHCHWWTAAVWLVFSLTRKYNMAEGILHAFCWHNNWDRLYKSQEAEWKRYTISQPQAETSGTFKMHCLQTWGKCIVIILKCLYFLIGNSFSVGIAPLPPKQARPVTTVCRGKDTLVLHVEKSKDGISWPNIIRWCMMNPHHTMPTKKRDTWLEGS